MNEILPNLYLSGYGDVPFNNDLYIVNCTEEMPMKSSQGTRIAVNDDMETASLDKMFVALISIVDVIHQKLQDGKKVVVHCLAGQQRSPTVIAAYLMKHHGYKLQNAIQYIREKRHEAFFWSINFLDTLQRYEQLLM